MRNADFTRLAIRVDSYLKDLSNPTSRAQQPAVVLLQKVIISYKGTRFPTFKSSADFTLTEKGQEAQDNAVNRVII